MYIYTGTHRMYHLLLVYIYSSVTSALCIFTHRVPVALRVLTSTAFLLHTLHVVTGVICTLPVVPWLTYTPRLTRGCTTCLGLHVKAGIGAGGTTGLERLVWIGTVKRCEHIKQHNENDAPWKPATFIKKSVLQSQN